MFLILGVSLYTSRIVLEVLGVSDFGIYNLVAGFITLLGFFNAAMSSATQRYLSYDIGKNDDIQLKKTFSSTLTIHFLIAIIGFILAETLGLWYINNKMIYPMERSFAINVVYQFSVLTFLLNIIQVPYNSLILARERMNIYAYVSIVEVLLKLGIVFILVYFGSDKLILYAFLTFVVSFVIRLIYQVYCRRAFVESRYKFSYDKKYFLELISYSGWNLFGNIATIARGQGNNLLLNLFFGTTVNAAYSIALQLQGAVSMFVTNFQIALNPRIIQNYASGDIQKSQKLVFQGSKFSYFLMLLLVLPFIFNTSFILETWLKNVPNHTIIFVRLCLISVLIDVISGPLMTLAQAVGKIKWYQIIIGTLIFLNLPVSYYLLRSYHEPALIFIAIIALNLVALIFRIFFLKDMANFDVKSFCTSVLFKIALITILMSTILYYIKDIVWHVNPILNFLISSISIDFIALSCILSIGLTASERLNITSMIKKKLFN